MNIDGPRVRTSSGNCRAGCDSFKFIIVLIMFSTPRTGFSAFRSAVDRLCPLIELTLRRVASIVLLRVFEPVSDLVIVGLGDMFPDSAGDESRPNEFTLFAYSFNGS